MSTFSCVLWVQVVCSVLLKQKEALMEDVTGTFVVSHSGAASFLIRRYLEKGSPALD